MITRPSTAKRPETDLLTSALGAAAGAMLAGRPKLSPQDIFAALLGAYAAATGAAPAPANGSTAQQRQARPWSSPAAPRRAAKAKRCTQCSHPPAPGLRHCKPCLKKARARTRRWEIRKAAAALAQQAKAGRKPSTARKPAKGARVTPISSAVTKSKESKSWRKPRAPARAVPTKPKRFTKAVRESLQGGKKEFFQSLDRANGGMVSKYIELLNDNSPILKSLSDGSGRPRQWRFQTWTAAVEWILPARSHRWDAVDARRLRAVSDAMKQALTMSAGGMSDLSRAGLAFVDLRLPDETEKVLERQRQAEGYFDEQARQTG